MNENRHLQAKNSRQRRPVAVAQPVLMLMLSTAPARG
jgi:hypothetical protein